MTPHPVSDDEEERKKKKEKRFGSFAAFWFATFVIISVKMGLNLAFNFVTVSPGMRIFWANICPRQNKNNFLVWFLADLIRHQVYSRIDFKFLIPSHTYGPTDRNFAVIGKYAAKVDSETVYTPQQWYV